MNFRMTFIAYLLVVLASHAGVAFGADAATPPVATANVRDASPSGMVSLASENGTQAAPPAEAVAPPQPSAQEQAAKSAAAERTQDW